MDQTNAFASANVEQVSDMNPGRPGNENQYHTREGSSTNLAAIGTSLDPACGTLEHDWNPAHHTPDALAGSSAAPWLHRQQTPAMNAAKQDAPTTPNTVVKPLLEHFQTTNAQHQPLVVTAQPKQGDLTSRVVYLRKFLDYTYNMPPGPILNFTVADVLVLLVNWFKTYPQLTNRFLNNGLNAGVHFTILQEHRVLTAGDKELLRIKDTLADGYRRTLRQIDEKWTMASHQAPDDWNENLLSVNHLTHKKGSFTAPVPFMNLMIDIKKVPQGADAGDLTRALEFATNNQKRGHNGELLDWMFPTDLHIILGHIGYTAITQDHFDNAVIERYRVIYRQKEAVERKRRRDLTEKSLPTPPTKCRHIAGEKFWDDGTAQPRIPPPKFEPLSQGSRQEAPAVPSVQTGAVAAVSSQRLDEERITASQPTIEVTEPWPQFRESDWLTPVLKDATAPLQDGNGINGAFAPSAELANFPKLNQPFHPTTTNADSTPDLPNDFDFATSLNRINESGVSTTQCGTVHEHFTFNQENIESGIAEIDALIAINQTYDFFGLLTPDLEVGPFAAFAPNALAELMQEHETQYPVKQVLRDCVEADDADDQGVLARSARWCSDPENCAGHYTVGDLGFVVTLQKMVEDSNQCAGVLAQAEAAE
jgi:hypothetical protein